MQHLRTILRLTHQQGLSAREIGLRLKLSEAAVADCLRRAQAAGLDRWPLPPGTGDDMTAQDARFQGAERSSPETEAADPAQAAPDPKHDPKQDPRLRGVTADDVAARAGLSRWTVTRAFKKESSISAGSRRRVMEAAEALGYVPDLLASTLASDRSDLVALLVDDFDNPHKLVMLEQLTRVLRQNGWATILVNTLGADTGARALLSASQRRIDAAILIGTQFDEAIMRGSLGARRLRKLVVFGRSSTSGTMSIRCDDHAAMTAIADHLAQRGCRNPLFLAGPDVESTRLARKEAFLRRWAALHRAPEPAVIRVPRYGMQDAHDGLHAYLRDIGPDRRPDAVVCENDLLALGAIDAIRSTLGLRVPQDIAVTGFDDIPLAAAPSYRLTTCRQPLAQMAEALARLLAEEEPAAGPIILPATLVLRDSA